LSILLDKEISDLHEKVDHLAASVEAIHIQLTQKQPDQQQYQPPTSPPVLPRPPFFTPGPTFGPVFPMQSSPSSFGFNPGSASVSTSRDLMTGPLFQIEDPVLAYMLTLRQSEENDKKRNKSHSFEYLDMLLKAITPLVTTIMLNKTVRSAHEAERHEKVKPEEVAKTLLNKAFSDMGVTPPPPPPPRANAAKGNGKAKKDVNKDPIL
jgi:hypothetical protein